MISRLPRPEIMISAVERLDEKTISRDSLSSLDRNWPEEFNDFVVEAKENPEIKWDKAEAFFLSLSKVKKIDLRIKLWLFKIDFLPLMDNYLN